MAKKQVVSPPVIDTGIFTRSKPEMVPITKANLKQSFESIKSNLEAYDKQFSNPLYFIEKAESLCRRLWSLYCDESDTKHHADSERRHETRRDILKLENQCEHVRHLLKKKDESVPGVMWHIGYLTMKIEIRAHEPNAKRGKTRVFTNANSRKKHSVRLASRNQNIVADINTLLKERTLKFAQGEAARKYKLGMESIKNIWQNRGK